jgi:Holliday junction DNA helicase RuvA
LIARISGRVEEVTTDAVLIDVGSGLWYEVLVPACEAARLSRLIGQDVILHTIHYIEGDPTRGGQTPRLVGFADESGREFFRLFTKVKGIGVRKALRALVRPFPEVAAAIQAKDIPALVALPEIGRRTAETVIAELHGKVDHLAGPASAERPQLSEAAEEALAVLVQLGERRADAAALVERVLAVAPETPSAETIIQQAYKLKAGGI